MKCTSRHLHKLYKKAFIFVVCTLPFWSQKVGRKEQPKQSTTEATCARLGGGEGPSWHRTGGTPLVVVVVDAGSVPEAVGAPGTDGGVFIVVTVVVIVVVVSVPASALPIGDIVFKFLVKKEPWRAGLRTHVWPCRTPGFLCVASLRWLTPWLTMSPC